MCAYTEMSRVIFFSVYLFYRAGDILRAPSFIWCVSFCRLLDYTVSWRLLTIVHIETHADYFVDLKIDFRLD